MSYCRFRNTLQDLRDCYDNWDTLEEGDSEELEARAEMLVLCSDILSEYDRG
jgi:hypothetical protein